MKSVQNYSREVVSDFRKQPKITSSNLQCWWQNCTFNTCSLSISRIDRLGRMTFWAVLSSYRFVMFSVRDRVQTRRPVSNFTSTVARAPKKEKRQKESCTLWGRDRGPSFKRLCAFSSGLFGRWSQWPPGSFESARRDVLHRQHSADRLLFS